MWKRLHLGRTVPPEALMFLIPDLKISRAQSICHQGGGSARHLRGALAACAERLQYLHFLPKEKIVEVPTVEVREVIKQVSKPEASNAAQVWLDTDLGGKDQVAKDSTDV